MSAIVNVKTKVDAQLHPAVVLPTILTLNTLVLYGFDQAGMIPGWLKLAVTALLAF